jgi:hypothetical protein
LLSVVAAFVPPLLFRVSSRIPSCSNSGCGHGERLVWGEAAGLSSGIAWWSSLTRVSTRFLLGRFIIVALFDAAWAECKRIERDAMRLALFSQVGNVPAEAIEDSSASLDRME